MDPLTIGLLLGGGALVKGATSAYGANQQRLAARDQLRAADRAKGQIDQSYGEAKLAQEPYSAAGQVGLERMMKGDYVTALPGQAQMPEAYQGQEFNYDQYSDPSTQFRIQQGSQAIQQGAAGQGAGLSGSTLKALAKFGQNLGSQEYGAAYGRFGQQQDRNLQGYQTNLGRANDIWGQSKDVYTMGNQQKTQSYNRAADLGNYGQAAANNLSTMATGYGGDIAGLYGAQGQIQAQGRLAPAQTYMNAAGDLANMGMDAYTLGQLGQGVKQPSGVVAQKAWNKSPYGPAVDRMLKGR